MSHIINPFQVNWTPAQLGSGLKAWYDAADLDTIVASAGAVSEWKDKSGNGFHLTQGSASLQPKTGTRSLGGRNVMDFDGSDDVLWAGTTGLFRNVGQGLICAVVEADEGTNEHAIIDISNGVSRGSGRSKLQIDADQWGIGGRRLDADSYTEKLFASPAYADSTPYVAVGIWDHTNNLVNVAIDGVLGTAVAYLGSGNTSDTDSVEAGVGARAQDPVDETFDGGIAEIIVVHNDITTATRQLIEGYLAWKWGI